MLKGKHLTQVSLCNIVCALMMLVLLILQFTPFWQYGEEGASASIGAYVWFPTENAAVGTAIKEAVGDDFTIESIVGVAVLLLLLSAAGIAACLIKMNSPVVSALPVACGLVGLYSFLTKPALRLGMNWGFQLALCIAMLIIGAVSLGSMLAGRKAHAVQNPSAA